MSNETNSVKKGSSQITPYVGRAISSIVCHIPPTIFVSRTWDPDRIAKESSRTSASR